MLFAWIVIGAYLLLTLLIGFFAARHTNSAGEFQGKQLTTAAVVFAAAGEWLGGTATFGVSEYGFTYGISGAWCTIANGLGVLFLAFLFAKLYRSLNLRTVPAIVSHYFGVSARHVSCVLLVLVMLVVGLSQIIAAGKLGQALLGVEFKTTVTIFAFVFILFTFFGGMRSVAAANCMHLVVMYAGCIIALLICVYEQGGTAMFAATAKNIEPEIFDPTAISGTKIPSWIIASLLGACTAQAGIQPVLAAKDVPTAKRSCLYTALVMAPFGLVSASLGIAARVLSAAYSLRGAIFVVLLFGIHGKSQDSRSACVSMILTGIVAVLWTVVKTVAGTYPVAPWFTETYAAILTAVLSMVACTELHRKTMKMGG